MSRASKKKKEISRRDFIKRGAAGSVALPFALAIPSNAKNVVTSWERLRTQKEREASWRTELENKLGQGAKLPPGAKNPPPPPTQRQPVPYNTTYDTTKDTTKQTSTNSNDPPKADDNDSDGYYDGSKEDWKTDYH